MPFLGCMLPSSGRPSGIEARKSKSRQHSCSWGPHVPGGAIPHRHQGAKAKNISHKCESELCLPVTPMFYSRIAAARFTRSTIHQAVRTCTLNKAKQMMAHVQELATVQTLAQASTANLPTRPSVGSVQPLVGERALSTSAPKAA